MYIYLYQSLLKRHQDELAKDKTELDAQLASISSQEEVARVIRDHERRLQVLYARQQREKEENMAALKQKLIARKSGKVSITDGQLKVNIWQCLIYIATSIKQRQVIMHICLILTITGRRCSEHQT